jgi:hypothetical protein
MYILQIEHPVQNFDAWKKAFDSDPVNRAQSGVLRYNILRPAGDPNYAIVHLEFDSSDKAEALLTALRKLWTRVEGKIMENPQARILEVTEHKEY